MSLQEIKTLFHLVFSPIRGSSHQERLESFYQNQASGYDEFRERLLHGRRELFEEVLKNPPKTWVDAGAGTGYNLGFWKGKLEGLEKGFLVDLSPSLLKQARKKIEAYGAHQVESVEVDFCEWAQPQNSIDLITFSYSLTMIPNWFHAIDMAYQLLKPGGRIAVVDFYVSRKYPNPSLKKHAWWARSFWPIWFASDGVFLNPEHLAYLQYRFKDHSIVEKTGSIPYLPLKAPYYLFIGKK